MVVLFSDSNFIFFRVDQRMPRKNSKVMTFPNAVDKTTFPPTSIASDNKVFSTATTHDKAHIYLAKDSDLTSYNSNLLFGNGRVINYNETALQVKTK